MAEAPITGLRRDCRVLLAAFTGRAAGVTIRALLWSGGRLLLWADALAVGSARLQDVLLPPSAAGSAGDGRNPEPGLADLAAPPVRSEEP